MALSTSRARNVSIDPVSRSDAAPELAEPKSLIVFCDKRTGNAVAISTGVEKERGRIAGHLFAEYAAHEDQPLNSSPQIGQPFAPALHQA